MPGPTIAEAAGQHSIDHIGFSFTTIGQQLFDPVFFYDQVIELLVAGFQQEFGIGRESVDKAQTHLGHDLIFQQLILCRGAFIYTFAYAVEALFLSTTQTQPERRCRKPDRQASGNK